MSARGTLCPTTHSYNGLNYYDDKDDCCTEYKLVAADSPSGAMSAAATPVAAAQASSMPAESVAAVASVAVTASVAVIGGGGLPSIDTSAVAMATVSASLSAANERERARADLRRSGVGPVCSYHAFRYGRSMRGWRWWRG